jgi:hypothetical protein
MDDARGGESVISRADIAVYQVTAGQVADNFLLYYLYTKNSPMNQRLLPSRVGNLLYPRLMGHLDNWMLCRGC